MFTLDQQFKIKKEHIALIKAIHRATMERGDGGFTRKELNQIEALWTTYPIDAWVNASLGLGIIEYERKIIRGLKNRDAHIKLNILTWVMQLPARPNNKFFYDALCRRYAYQRILQYAYNYKR